MPPIINQTAHIIKSVSSSELAKYIATIVFGYHIGISHREGSVYSAALPALNL